MSRRSRPQREIPLTSFMDMFLALLVFPMVSIGAWNAAVSLRLPEARGLKAHSSPPRERAVFVYVTAEATTGQWTYHVLATGETDSTAPLAQPSAKEAARLAAELQDNARTTGHVIVCVDRACPHRHVATLLGELTAAGVSQARLRVRTP